MRRACRKILGSVPCTRRKNLPTDSMEEILRTKLSTIMEEPELCEEKLTPPRYKWMTKKKLGKKNKIQPKDNKTQGCLQVPLGNLKQSYVLFISGFASKGTFGGFLQY
ncbi:hypothetical protein G2W53_023505 [Senna tora]|uniref:Uncharacterized protein n=1 Tax=Senna tora TaxID=362788 RepID=A0A834TBA8_9FABA|nr:hypothetical protein G2W53_023505 [Senna tora]